MAGLVVEDTVQRISTSKVFACEVRVLKVYIIRYQVGGSEYVDGIHMWHVSGREL